MIHSPKYRWPLNTQQLEVLNLLYKFRFGSSDLIAKCFGKKSGDFVYKRLKILLEQGFIGKRFDRSYRIKGWPAAYFLLPKGVLKLNEDRQSSGKEKIKVERFYKEKIVSESFIKYCLDVFQIYCDLNSRYGDRLRFFTKSQLVGRYDYFSEFVPGVYLQITTNGVEKDYFLEYLQSSKPFFAIAQRLREYIDYADDGAWEAEIGGEFPKVLLVCEIPSLQNRLLKRTGSILEDADERLCFYVTTNTNLKKDNTNWRSLTDSDGFLQLNT